MAETIDNNKVYWVRGNTQPFIIPLEQEIVTEDEQIVAEPYYPDENAEIVVNFVGEWKRYPYTPQVDGNLLIFTENATIPAGIYGVEVIVKNPDGTQRRSMWDNQVVITNSNHSVLQEWDEFKSQDVKARAALFFFAKGDKGDAFTYEDFTQEQIEDLKKPARDAAAEITEDYNTNVKEDYATVKQNAQQATSDANAAAELANQKAEDANAAAQNANEKAGYAKDKGDYAKQQGDYAKEQGDYAKQKGDEVEDAKGTYLSLGSRLDAMDTNTNSRLEKITEEQFDEIFN